MSDLSAHAVKLLNNFRGAAAEQAICGLKYKGVDNSARVQRKLDAHRQSFGSRYWKLRDYIAFLEAAAPDAAVAATRLLPSQRSEEATDG